MVKTLFWGCALRVVVLSDLRSNAQAGISFQDLLNEDGLLSALPQGGGVQDAIPDWPAVRFFAPRNGARDADELGAHLIGRQSDLRITVSAEIDELEVRSQIRVGERPGALQVEALCIFEARTDAVLQQHVEGPVRLRLSRPVGEKERPERSVLRKIVLVGLHGAGAR